MPTILLEMSLSSSGLCQCKYVCISNKMHRLSILHLVLRIALERRLLVCNVASPAACIYAALYRDTKRNGAASLFTRYVPHQGLIV